MGGSMSYEDILYEKVDGVAMIAINRPQKLNALRSLTIEELTAALRNASSDGRVGVIVIRGSGGRAFSVGGDMEEMKDLTRETGRMFLGKFLDLILAIRRVPQPVLAAVQGYCLGGGNEINLACDLSLASRDATFGQVGPKVGSSPLMGGTQLLPKALGEKRAREVIFLCRQYTAQEAYEMGWVNRVVPPEALDQEVNAWCEEILSLSPQALRVAKLSLNFDSDALYPSYLHAVELLSSLYGTEEFQEGVRAFFERRRPDFARFRRL